MSSDYSMDSASLQAESIAHPLQHVSAEHFLEWEQSTHDTIDVKRIYLKIAGDITTGILCSSAKGTL